MIVDAAGQPVIGEDKKPTPLAGTYLIAQIDDAASRVRIIDSVNRAAVHSAGTFNVAKAEVGTYYLVGPMYFYFFVAVMALMGVIFIFFAMAYKEQTFVREA